MDKLSIYGMDVASITATVRKLQNIGGKKIGLQFLPWYESATEKTMWDILRAVSPIATFRAVDGEAQLVGRQAFDQGYADIQDFANKTRFNASDLRWLREAGENPTLSDGTPSMAAKMASEVKVKIRRALEDLRGRVDNRVEWLQINALLGTISYTGKVVFSVDYGVAFKNLTSPTAPWTDYANSNPIKDIEDWQQLVNDLSGVLPDTLILSRKALIHASRSVDMRNRLQYTNPVMSSKKAQQLIEDELGLKITVYDSRYTDEAGTTSTRFLDENRLIMLPSLEQLPDGVGDTATVGHPLADFVPGHYTWQDESKDPYGLEVGVGLSAFPRIKHPETMLNAVLW